MYVWSTSTQQLGSYLEQLATNSRPSFAIVVSKTIQQYDVLLLSLQQSAFVVVAGTPALHFQRRCR